MPVDALIGDLGEPAEMLAKTAGDKQRRFVERHIIVFAEMLWRWVLILACAGKRSNRHRRDRDRGMRAQRIAAELELTAERRQLGTKAADMARFARLPRLLRECRHGTRGTR